MEAVPQTTKVYVTADGKQPFHDWLRALKDQTARAKIRVRLNRLRLGNFGDVRSVGRGVSELRIPHGPGYRVYFGRSGQQVILVLCGGDKSTQRRDIENAKAYWKDYQGRTT